MRLIITRHGETIENQRGIMQGHLPGRLSERGIRQAKQLGLRLKDEKIDIIYSSDLARAQDTAKEVHKYHQSIPFVLTDKLRERSWGKLDGTYRKETKNLFERKDIESERDFMGRNRKILEEIFNSKHENVLIVSHGGCNVALTAHILRIPFKESIKIGPINNTAVTIFDPVPKLKIHGCIRHLE